MLFTTLTEDGWATSNHFISYFTCFLQYLPFKVTHENKLPHPKQKKIDEWQVPNSYKIHNHFITTLRTVPKANTVSSPLTALDGFFLPDFFINSIKFWVSTITNSKGFHISIMGYVRTNRLPSLDACPGSYIAADRKHSFLNHLSTSFIFYTPPSYSLCPPQSLLQPEES